MQASCPISGCSQKCANSCACANRCRARTCAALRSRTRCREYPGPERRARPASRLSPAGTPRRSTSVAFSAAVSSTVGRRQQGRVQGQGGRAVPDADDKRGGAGRSNQDINLHVPRKGAKTQRHKKDKTQEANEPSPLNQSYLLLFFASLRLCVRLTPAPARTVFGRMSYPVQARMAAAKSSAAADTWGALSALYCADAASVAGRAR